nr:hypothetical protein [Sphingomonas sp. CDS-1]
MTSVVIWRQRELVDLSNFGGVASMHIGDIWIAADSRISSATNSGSRVVPTDAALKILPINLMLFQEYEHGPGGVPVYEGQFAFAFAGGVLPASMTYAMAISYLRGLTGPYDADLPTIGDIVGLINRIGATYAAETSQAFETFLVGVCPLHHRSNKDHAYRLRFDKTGMPRTPELLDLMPDGSFALLGSNQGTIGKMIEEGFAANLEYNPALAIKSIIEEEIAGDIGGYLHLGRVRGGVDIYPAWRGDSGSLPSPYADGKIGGLGRWRVNGIFGIA